MKGDYYSEHQLETTADKPQILGGSGDVRHDRHGCLRCAAGDDRAGDGDYCRHVDHGGVHSWGRSGGRCESEG